MLATVRDAQLNKLVNLCRERRETGNFEPFEYEFRYPEMVEPDVDALVVKRFLYEFQGETDGAGEWIGRKVSEDWLPTAPAAEDE